MISIRASLPIERTQFSHIRSKILRNCLRERTRCIREPAHLLCNLNEIRGHRTPAQSFTFIAGPLQPIQLTGKLRCIGG